MGYNAIMKKSITACILILLLLMVLAAVCACVPQDFCTLKYTAGEGGTIVGELQQSIKRGTDGTKVTAVADDGYYFVKWSDNVLTVERQDRAVQDNINVTAIFSKSKSYTITYLVEEGGTLEGEAVQTICKDDGGTQSVSVVVKDGYEFLGWSDGHDELWRSDSYFNINYYYKQDTTFTAKIRRIDDYKLMDWYTEFGVGVPTLKITEKTVNNLSFPIPAREHFAFEGWYLGDTLVADTQGNSYFTKEMLEDGSRIITAKWTPNETFTYKILLVYLTRIDATLPVKEISSNEKVHIDYTMSELERQFCHLTTTRLKEYMDDMMDGIINFQIDEYYTEQTSHAEDFMQVTVGPGYLNNIIYPDQISEVSILRQNYDSALSVTNLDWRVQSSSGSAYTKYGQIFIDRYYDSIDAANITPKQAYEMLSKYKVTELYDNCSYSFANITESWIYTFVHELAHTIECRINGDDFHEIEHELDYRQQMNGYYPSQYYYLQEVIQDGKKVGIPYEFWSGNIMKVRYEPVDENVGYIRGQGYYTGDRIGAPHCIYEVPYGCDTPSVTAVASNGYEFVEWSDGVKTATRADTNIREDKTLTAIFKPLTYELTVVSGEGGRVTLGEGTWVLETRKFQRLKVEADEGYKFLGWSDGNMESERTFRLNPYEVTLFDENRKFTLTAIFGKIGEKSDYYVLNLIQSENGGYVIYGGTSKEKSVLMKKDVDEVTVHAWANVGYRFVQWSDGNTEKTRTFKINTELLALSDEDNVITIYAIYEKVEE